jgi:hypothetical protein
MAPPSRKMWVAAWIALGMAAASSMIAFPFIAGDPGGRGKKDDVPAWVSVLLLINFAILILAVATLLALRGERWLAASDSAGGDGSPLNAAAE